MPAIRQIRVPINYGLLGRTGNGLSRSAWRSSHSGDQVAGNAGDRRADDHWFLRYVGMGLRRERDVGARRHDLRVRAVGLAGLRLATAIGAEKMPPGRSGQPLESLLEVHDRPFAFAAGQLQVVDHRIDDLQAAA